MSSVLLVQRLCWPCHRLPFLAPFWSMDLTGYAHRFSWNFHFSIFRVAEQYVTSQNQNLRNRWPVTPMPCHAQGSRFACTKILPDLPASPSQPAPIERGGLPDTTNHIIPRTVWFGRLELIFYFKYESSMLDKTMKWCRNTAKQDLVRKIRNWKFYPARTLFWCFGSLLWFFGSLYIG